MAAVEYRDEAVATQLAGYRVDRARDTLVRAGEEPHERDVENAGIQLEP